MQLPVRLIRFNDLKPMKGIHYTRVHLYRLEAAGKFPKRLRVQEGGHAVAWLEREIDEYIEARAAERQVA